MKKVDAYSCSSEEQWLNKVYRLIKKENEL